MTAKDRWTVDLRCPQCGSAGTAHLWQEDGWSFSNGDQSTYIDSVPAGFRVATPKRGSFGIKFFCISCDIEAK
jgi:Zn ribbon nucleic-acid-binding protein